MFESVFYLKSRKNQMTHRRGFLKSAGATAATLLIPKWTWGQSPNEILNIGFIGVGGRGASNLDACSQENVVALSDVDSVRAAAAFKRFPKAKHYQDYRVMLEKEKTLDAVVVSTPDHMHALASIAAMKLGKHVYCEKPLARTIWEARQMAKVAVDNKVITQMGTQGHSFAGTRTAVEVIRSGTLGTVKEFHVWSDRPANWWPQGVDRPKGTSPVPESLKWDLWLGGALERPYHPAYVPFKWRGFWDFGTGAIGDMGIHNLDTAFWALQLDAPTHVKIVDSGKMTSESPPPWSFTRIDFAETAKRPAIKLMWYDGGKQPSTELFQGEEIPTNGSLIIGDKGTLFTRTWHGGSNANDMFLLLPRTTFADYKPPALTIPRPAGHHQEWLSSIKQSKQSEHGSNFTYAATLTETLLLGNISQRLGQPVQWDAASMKVKNAPEADELIKPEYRQGWMI